MKKIAYLTTYIPLATIINMYVGICTILYHVGRAFIKIATSSTLTLANENTFYQPR